MLKGNLIVGKNQSVVLHAQSLEDLFKLAESKCESSCQGEIKLRVDISPDKVDLSTLAVTNLAATNVVITSSKAPFHP